MKPVFERLLWFDDLQSRDGPENMAMDEVLWGRCTREGVPILRVYRWAGAWISFGYFQRSQEISPQLPQGVQAVRRCTGGGTVDHRSGQTYSLMLPQGHPWSAGRAHEVYRRIHGGLADVLAAAGLPVELVPEHEPNAHGPLGWCFLDPPVPGDLVQNGHKVAGAAQRRSRQGLLHQGQLAVNDVNWHRFANLLAPDVITFRPGAPENDAAMQLAQEKYRSSAWFTRQ